MLTICEFTEGDWDAMWQMIEPVFRAGDTYAYSPAITQEEAFAVWVTVPAATYVAKDEHHQILGTYYLKPNQPGQGAHVCNCGYIVAAAARGRGVASALCQHSQQMALAQGYLAMQYNLVVSTNYAAVKLWQKQGFHIVGTLTNAFNHPQFGYVDAFVMYKQLVT